MTGLWMQACRFRNTTSTFVNVSYPVMFNDGVNSCTIRSCKLANPLRSPCRTHEATRISAPLQLASVGLDADALGLRKPVGSDRRQGAREHFPRDDAPATPKAAHEGTYNGTGSTIPSFATSHGTAKPSPPCLLKGYRGRKSSKQVETKQPYISQNSPAAGSPLVSPSTRRKTASTVEQSSRSAARAHSARQCNEQQTFTKTQDDEKHTTTQAAHFAYFRGPRDRIVLSVH